MELSTDKQKVVNNEIDGFTKVRFLLKKHNKNQFFDHFKINCTGIRTHNHFVD